MKAKKILAMMALAGLGTVALAQSGPIRIGVVTQLTGTYAGIGEQVKWGLNLAAKEINASARKLSRSAPDTSLRPAIPVVIWPGNSAMVLVIFANFGSSPASISAGRVTKDPPPANAFCAPAQSPAKNSTAKPVKLRLSGNIHQP